MKVLRKKVLAAAALSAAMLFSIAGSAASQAGTADDPAVLAAKAASEASLRQYSDEEFVSTTFTDAPARSTNAPVSNGGRWPNPTAC